MNKELEAIRIAAEKSLKKVHTPSELDEVELSLFGRKQGSLTTALKSLKTKSEQERRKFGAQANELKVHLSETISHMRESFGAQEEDGKPFDPSEPLLPPAPRGSLHPITRMEAELVECFGAMGFRVLDGPELENDFYNFTALNIAPDHPARDMQDTFYIKDLPGRIMRTHTSPMQVRALKMYGAPLAAIVPGRVFRNEATDARHEHTFHQLEGFIVDKDISFANLKAVLEYTSRRLFGESAQVRLRPKYYPFVEPGVNGEVTCMLCEGKGCRVCKHTGFLETFGAGLIHPNVLRAADLDPRRWSGFAFGLGVTRLAMLKYGITDVRLFAGADPHFLRQF